MKFHCDRCKTRYSIADDKVRGKILKIRCKNCAQVITVKEGMELAGPTSEQAAQAVLAATPAPVVTSPAPISAPTPASAKPAPVAAKPNGNGQAHATPVLEDAFNRAMSRLPTPAPVDGGEDEEKTRIGGAPMLEETIEWYVAIDGDQEGPFTLAEAQKRVARKQPADEMYGWNDTMDDWLPVEKVPELASFVPAPKPKATTRPPKAAAPPPPPAEVAAKPAAPKAGLFDDRGANPSEEGMSLSALAAAAPSPPPPSVHHAPTVGGDPLDLEIGEASRVIRVADLNKDASKSTRPNPAARATARNGVAAIPARGTGAADALPIVDEPSASSAASAVMPARKKRTGLYLAVGGGLLATILVVLVVVIASQESDGSEAKQEVVDRRGSSFAEQVQSGGIGTGLKQRDPEGEKTQPPDTKAQVPEDAQPDRKATIRTNPIKKPITTDQTSKTGTGDPIGPKPPTDQEDIGLDDPTSNDPLDASEVFDKYGSNRGIIERCYNNELKVDPDFRPGRVQVTITIAGSGRVTNVEVPQTGSLKFNDCLKKTIMSWSFRKSPQGLKTAITLSFRAG
jgi:predicted Zn finger-like uncharacterized protein